MHITVLMSVYNAGEYLQSSVKSILNQTYRDFEFLIIDDGSEDNSEEVINSFRDSRIIYKKIPHTGLAGALNYGLKNSSGDYIARIDADDVNTLKRLERQIEFLNPDSHYDVIGSHSAYFNEQGKILFLIKPPSDDKDIKDFLNLHNPINHSSVLFDRKKILNEGGYNESFACYEDFELWFRLKDKLIYRIIPEVLVYTRLRKNSLTKTSSGNQILKLLLPNALQKRELSGSANEKKYWDSILFWINYFYGDKKNARNYLPPDVTFKNSLAYMNTFLPDKIFKESVEYRLRHRIELMFEGKEKYRSELKKLLK